jgi:hypothetical protein
MTNKDKDVLAEVRKEMDEILVTHGISESYGVQLRCKVFNKKDIPERTIVGINSGFDNQLRNFSYAEGIQVKSRRLDEFILSYCAELLESFPQRPASADAYSKRWHNTKKQRKGKKIIAIEDAIDSQKRENKREHGKKDQERDEKPTGSTNE